MSEPEVIKTVVYPVAEYEPFYGQLAELEKSNSSLVFDYESKKGNEEARSHVYALRKTKGALEKTRKSAKEESLQYGRLVDSEAKEIEARIESMIKVHQDKIDEIEKRETDRVEKLQQKLNALWEVHEGKTAAEYKYHIATLEAVVIDDSWQEFLPAAAKAKDASLAKHKEFLSIVGKQEAEQIELEKLRKEAAERDQKEREAEIAKSAGERARIEAEVKAAKELAESELKAKQEREASERRELELKLAAETAERRRIEAEQKAAIDAKAAADKAEDDRKKAILDEQARVALIARQEAEAQAKREANVAHLKKINNAALAALTAEGIDEEIAKKVLGLIAKDKIPHVKINY